MNSPTRAILYNRGRQTVYRHEFLEVSRLSLQNTVMINEISPVRVVIVRASKNQSLREVQYQRQRSVHLVALQIQHACRLLILWYSVQQRDLQSDQLRLMRATVGDI